MTAVLPERDLDVLDVVRSVHDDLDLPEGYRAEIIGCQIAVSASPFGKHALIVRRIERAVGDVLPPDYEVFENTTLEEPEGDRYIPDLAVWPIPLIETDVQWIFPASECLFVLEVTSPGQQARDRSKANGYARGGVPTHFLADRSARECVVFSDPMDSSYRTTTVFKFGEIVPLAFPGGSTARIDTSAF